MNITLKTLVSSQVRQLTSKRVISKVSPICTRTDTEYLSNDISSFAKNVVLYGIEEVPFQISDKNLVVEYSSPNIAKPFHVGHLRSTIIGNFISNLQKYLSHSVHRINYLGDWGTQFGFLKVGLDLSGFTPEMIKENPIKLLYEAYVLANQKAEIDPSISVRAREAFQQLEEGSLPDIDRWETFRNYTIQELQRVYRRLGVSFDEYNWESSYGAKDIQRVLKILEEKHILKLQNDGKKVAVISENRSVPLVKSDGSTLYLTRDIAAAIDRYTKYNFDQMYYVVDNAQTDHFTALFGILSKMEFPWAETLKHIKFGRIRDMSTRKGNVVFLQDILDEIKDIMHLKQKESKTTKILPDVGERTADVLGVSAIIISDLKQRRQRDYSFDWNRALQVQGDTGVGLQYTHCRLWSLERNSGASFPAAWDLSVLQEPPAKALLDYLIQFPQALQKSQQELEACILVNYLFRLSNLTNRAFKLLPIKNQNSHIGSQRLMLFHNARVVLNRGMRILGLQPLNEM